MKTTLILISFFTPLVFAKSTYEFVDQARPSLYGSTPKNIHCPVIIIPGESIGNIKIGTSLEDLKKLKFAIKQVRNTKDLYLLGPFVVTLMKDKVFQIETELGDLPDCIKYEKKTIPQKADLNTLKNIFKSCHDNPPVKGGNITNCQGVKIGTGGFGGQQKTPSIIIE